MKTGNRFSFRDLQQNLQALLGKKFATAGPYASFITKIKKYPDISCAKHVFYNKNFLKNVTIPWNAKTQIPAPWNEFDGISKARTLGNWNRTQWITSSETSLIHEIRDINHLTDVIKKEPLKRLIIGQVKEIWGREYVFLGMYELNQVKSFSYDNKTPYGVDGASFPLSAMGLKAPLISYSHCVWKRISDEWNG